MKFIVSLILIAFISFAACLYFPWWSVAIVAFFVAALIPQGAGKSFFTGFVALFLLWGGLSFWISNNNDHILAHKVSDRKSTRLNSSHLRLSRMPSSA